MWDGFYLFIYCFCVFKPPTGEIEFDNLSKKETKKIGDGKKTRNKKKKQLIVPCGISRAWVLDVDNHFYFGLWRCEWVCAQLYPSVEKEKMDTSSWGNEKGKRGQLFLERETEKDKKRGKRDAISFCFSSSIFLHPFCWGNLSHTFWLDFWLSAECKIPFFLLVCAVEKQNCHENTQAAGSKHKMRIFQEICWRLWCHLLQNTSIFLLCQI